MLGAGGAATLTCCARLPCCALLSVESGLTSHCTETLAALCRRALGVGAEAAGPPGEAALGRGWAGRLWVVGLWGTLRPQWSPGPAGAGTWRQMGPRGRCDGASD